MTAGVGGAAAAAQRAQFVRALAEVAVAIAQREHAAGRTEIAA